MQKIKLFSVKLFFSKDPLVEVKLGQVFDYIINNLTKMEKPKKLAYRELIYETRDLNESSLLKALGAKYLGSKLKERDVWLAFANKEACEERLSEYMNGAFPEIESFINAQREVKNIILKLTARR